MRFLDFRRVLSNMWAATYHLTGAEYDLSELKKRFVDSMNQAQGSAIRVAAEGVYIDFENADLVDFLIAKGELETQDTVDGRHLYGPRERAAIRARIAKAVELVDRAAPRLAGLLTSVIGTVSCYRSSKVHAGTVSSCVGLIHLSPHKDWSVAYYAEMLVHELIHNCVFLEDMVRSIFPDYRILDDDDARVVSVIRKTPRAFDKSYHSACVAIGLMYFHHLCGAEKKARSLLRPLRATMSELGRRDHELRAKGKEIVSVNGRGLMGEMAHFAETVDYGLLATALSTAPPDRLRCSATV